MKRMAGIAAVLALSTWNVRAQDVSFAIEPQDQQMQQIRSQLVDLLNNHKVLGMEGLVMGATVKGAPYSADEIRETTQTLGDGTRIHSEAKVSVYRDGEGRIRRETPTSVEIWDSTAGTTYMLNPKNMTYRTMEVHGVVRQGDGSAHTSTFVDRKSVV